MKGPDPFKPVIHDISVSPAFDSENVSTSKIIEMISDFSLLRDDFTDLDGPDNDDNVVTSADVIRVFLRKTVTQERTYHFQLLLMPCEIRSLFILMKI